MTTLSFEWGFKLFRLDKPNSAWNRFSTQAKAQQQADRLNKDQHTNRFYVEGRR